MRYHTTIVLKAIAIHGLLAGLFLCWLGAAMWSGTYLRYGAQVFIWIIPVVVLALLLDPESYD